ncbi:MAG: hypothetical protein R3E93_06545 [Thiothrix sp.]
MQLPDTIPAQLPFLQALCWQRDSLESLSTDEILDLYERGWNYRGILADLEGEELEFVKALAQAKQSWLVNDV